VEADMSFIEGMVVIFLAGWVVGFFTHAVFEGIYNAIHGRGKVIRRVRMCPACGGGSSSRFCASCKGRGYLLR
jgi:hypothetical protein